MPTMKAVQTSRSGVIEVVEVERPVPGPHDVLMRVRACGICGTDATFVHLGGMPTGLDGQTRLDVTLASTTLGQQLDQWACKGAAGTNQAFTPS